MTKKKSKEVKLPVPFLDTETPEEREMIKAYFRGEFVPVDDGGELMRITKIAATNYMKKNARVNIRISNRDLLGLKRKAVEEGLPYQTLIASVLHKFVSGRLIPSA